MENMTKKEMDKYVQQVMIRDYLDSKESGDHARAHKAFLYLYREFGLLPEDYDPEFM